MEYSFGRVLNPLGACKTFYILCYIYIYIYICSVMHTIKIRGWSIYAYVSYH